MEIKKNMVKRTVVDEVILVPIENTSLALKGLITLNETAELLWDALPAAKGTRASLPTRFARSTRSHASRRSQTLRNSLQLSASIRLSEPDRCSME